MARVFPVPAPASTQTGPRRAVATWSCSGSSPASTSSADRADGAREASAAGTVVVIAAILAGPCPSSKDSPHPSRRSRKFMVTPATGEAPPHSLLLDPQNFLDP